MKRLLHLAAAALLACLGAHAQTYTVTPSATTYSTGGGQISFAVSLSYPANATRVQFYAAPPTSAWVHVSTSGPNIPDISPLPGDTVDPTNPPAASFGWTYTTIPTSNASFVFVLSYPASLAGTQAIGFSGEYRVGTSVFPVSIPAINLTPSTAATPPSISAPPGNITATAGLNAIFSAGITGSPTPTMQWQRSTDGGSSYTNLSNDSTYAGVNTSTLTVKAATTAMTGHRFRITATNASGSVTSTAGILTVVTPPTITTQPSSQAALTGSTVTFTVAATGTAPLSYQWVFTPAGTTTPQDVPGATSATLTLTNVQPSASGDYVCVVRNGVNPEATSAAAQLVVATRIVRIASQTGAAGSSVVVPVQLLANGDENAVSFTLQFNAAKLGYGSAALGSDAANGTLVPNVTQAGSGLVSFIVSKPSGQAFAAGTRTILNITFNVSLTATGGDVLGLTFSDALAARQIVSAGGASLPGPFVNGSVTATSGLEGDVNGDGVVDLSDWVKLGRYVVGLDPLPPAGATFMKADCAPRATRGDAAIDLSDWVQAGRFVVGLDTPDPAGGPSGPP